MCQKHITLYEGEHKVNYLPSSLPLSPVKWEGDYFLWIEREKKND